MDKDTVVPAMEYYSAGREAEILPLATVWMDPENIRL